jgi:hypothetical protein
VTRGLDLKRDSEHIRAAKHAEVIEGLLYGEGVVGDRGEIEASPAASIQVSIQLSPTTS